MVTENTVGGGAENIHFLSGRKSACISTVRSNRGRKLCSIRVRTSVTNDVELRYKLG